MRVLLSAYACFPDVGSEPGIGWGLATHLNDQFDITVLTSSRNRDRIEPQLQQLPRRVRFVYVDSGTESRSPTGPGPLMGGRSVAGDLFVMAEYARWQRKALRVAQDLHSKENFDLVHHATFVSAWLPSFMGRLGIPFVWNAGTVATTPAAFLRSMSPRAGLQEAARTVRVRLALPPSRRVTICRGTTVITSSPEARWPRRASTRSLLLGALTDDELAVCGEARPTSRRIFRVASVGRLLGWKGFELALRGFARARSELPELELWVIGDGPERGHLERLSAQLRCTEAVRFFGGLTRTATLAALKEVDVLLYPSFREQFGYVILEAMASAVPTITLATGGAGLLTAGIGRQVELQRPEAVVQDLAAAVVGFALDRAGHADAAAHAREHAKQQWSWRALADRIGEVYQTSAARVV
jgi:glycosyltransferase involved in cell wall biosynthesis